MIKETINMIDRELKAACDSVAITEGADRADRFFDILLEKVVGGRRVRMRAFISKPDLEGKPVRWRYLADTDDPGGHVVERVSDAASVARDMVEVVDRGRLDESYLSSLEEVGEAPAPAPAERPERSRLVEALEAVGMVHMDSRLAAEDGVMVEVSTFRGTGRATDARRAEMAIDAVGGARFFWSGDSLVVKYMI